MLRSTLFSCLLSLGHIVRVLSGTDICQPVSGVSEHQLYGQKMGGKEPMEPVGALILAGGRSSRMGLPKPWLTFKCGETYLGRIAALYRSAGFTEVVAVCNAEFCTGQWAPMVESLPGPVSLILNHSPDLGRLHSVRLGLCTMRPVHVFIHNVDSPLVSLRTINSIRCSLPFNGTVIPTFAGRRGHPVAIGPDVTLHLMQRCRETDTLRDVIALHRICTVETDDPGILTDINTPEQYSALFHEDI